MKTAARKKLPSGGRVLKAAEFKARALAVMRRVRDTGQSVTVTSRGKALVRIEPVRETSLRRGFGCMRGTVEFCISEDQLVSAPSSASWETLREWDEADGS